MDSLISPYRPGEAGPVIIAPPEPVTEDTLTVLVARNPKYRLETMADGRLVISSGKLPWIASDISAVTIGDEMPGFTLNAQAVFDAGEDFT